MAQRPCTDPANLAVATLTGDPSLLSGGSHQQNTRRIGELKKKLVLAEGQRKAYTGDWTQREKHTADALGDLKKEIKRLTAQLVQLNNANRRPATTVGQRKAAASAVADDALAAASSVKAAETGPAIIYPVGARSAAEAVQLTDLQHIQSVKQLDLLNARYSKRAHLFDQLYERYQELMLTASQAAKAASSVGGASETAAGGDAASTSAISRSSGPAAAAAAGAANSAPGASTLTELQHRERIAALENDIHRTHVQWMEAEHIRKKYRCIGSALSRDSERFERTLGQLEVAQRTQDADIERMQQAHHEAQVLRDGTKVALLRQEHSVQGATRTRERQAADCRRQVEERKAELERLERRLFAVPVGVVGGAEAPASAKTLPSGGGKRRGSGDSMTADDADTDWDTSRAANDAAAKNPAARRLNSAERAKQQQLHRLEQQFRALMEQTGAPTPAEVLERYVAQRESTARLGYLRTVAETEKQRLELGREQLSGQLETSKFSAVKETDENQEEVDELKAQLHAEDTLAANYATQTEHSGHVIDAIQQTLLDLILKLQEVDEIIDGVELRQRQAANGPGDEDSVEFELADLLSGGVDDAQLLRILEDKFRKGIAWGDAQQQQRPADAIDPDAPPDIASLRLDDLLPLPTGSPSGSRPPTSALDERERPQAFPSCYSTLMAAGRLSSSVAGGGAASAGGGGGHVGAASVTPGQLSQSAATDDEAEVPSRGFIKRQAQSIVDAKSRRKGFRAPRR